MHKLREMLIELRGVNLQGSWEQTNTNLWVASNVMHIDSK